MQEELNDHIIFCRNQIEKYRKASESWKYPEISKEIISCYEQEICKA